MASWSVICPNGLIRMVQTLLLAAEPAVPVLNSECMNAGADAVTSAAAGEHGSGKTLLRREKIDSIGGIIFRGKMKLVIHICRGELYSEFTEYCTVPAACSTKSIGESSQSIWSPLNLKKQTSIRAYMYLTTLL